MKIDKYLSYELLMLIDLIKENEGTFSMNEKGDWVVCIKPFQYQGSLWTSYSFRNAYCFLMNKLDNP